MSIYKFTLDADHTFFTRLRGGRFENEWIRLHLDGQLVVKGGYSWDGASPKWKVAGRIVGTWDGPVDPLTDKQKLYYPTCLHDAVSQFAAEIAAACGFTVREVLRKSDDDFDYYMGLYRVHPVQRRLYYWAVRKFHYPFWLIQRARGK